MLKSWAMKGRWVCWGSDSLPRFYSVKVLATVKPCYHHKPLPLRDEKRQEYLPAFLKRNAFGTGVSA